MMTNPAHLDDDQLYEYILELEGMLYRKESLPGHTTRIEVQKDLTAAREEMSNRRGPQG